MLLSSLLARPAATNDFMLAHTAEFLVDNCNDQQLLQLLTNGFEKSCRQLFPN